MIAVPEFFSWSTWDFDWYTVFVLLWFLQFAVIEFIGRNNNEMVTDHLRPIFHAAPITWWIALGVWLWLGPHMLFPALEDVIRRTVGA